MIFATRKVDGKLDGELLLVHPNREQAIDVSCVCSSLRELLENWDRYVTELEEINRQIRKGIRLTRFNVLKLSEVTLMACMPRTWLFADGSAFIHHIKLVRKARNAELPPTLLTVPLVYQGESGSFLAPTEEIPQISESHGTDFEGEVGVFVDRVPMGVKPDQASRHIKLVTLINDVSLRGLIPQELSQGFGFFVSKPQKALAPFAVTLDELGSHWRDDRLHLNLDVTLNGQFFGCANAGEMHFSFAQLIAHVAQTRPLAAGSLIGSGTVSNDNPKVGSSCIVERRMIEQIETGQASFPYLKPGDVVTMEMRDPENGISIFGKIQQVVKSIQVR